MTFQEGPENVELTDVRLREHTDLFPLAGDLGHEPFLLQAPQSFPDGAPADPHVLRDHGFYYPAPGPQIADKDCPPQGAVGPVT
jgi:hypothetical protein